MLRSEDLLTRLVEGCGWGKAVIYVCYRMWVFVVHERDRRKCERHRYSIFKLSGQWPVNLNSRKTWERFTKMVRNDGRVGRCMYNDLYMQDSLGIIYYIYSGFDLPLRLPTPNARTKAKPPTYNADDLL